MASPWSWVGWNARCDQFGIGWYLYFHNPYVRNIMCVLRCLAPTGSRKKTLAKLVHPDVVVHRSLRAMYGT